VTRTTVQIRFLVPRRSAAGRIDYCVETRDLRLPLRRSDRLELRERLERPR
jgi:hypothetical protein